MTLAKFRAAQQRMQEMRDAARARRVPMATQTASLGGQRPAATVRPSDGG